MTRYTENEKVMLRRAKMPAAVTRTAGVDSVAAALGDLLEATRRPLRRAAIARELTRLDDRMLADIGVRRFEIDTIADAAASARAASIGGALGGLFVALGKAVAQWRERRAAYRELMALDDRMLRDIGISRADIPAVLAAGDRAFADLPAATSDGDALEAFRRWNRSRTAAKELNTLDDRMLNDMGMVRGDIDWVAEELAVRSLRPANRNRAFSAA